MTLRPLLLAVLASLPLAASAEDMPTRFGTLSTTEDNILLFDGAGFMPEIQGNNFLSFLGLYRQGDSDIVLVQDSGGTACPALYYFITAGAAGARATPAFGTCSDLVTVVQGDSSVELRMPGFAGPFEPAASQQRAAREKHVFVLKGGVLRENGKVVK